MFHLYKHINRFATQRKEMFYHYMFKHSLWSPIQTNHKTCLRPHQASERPTRQSWKNKEIAAEICWKV